MWHSFYWNKATRFNTLHGNPALDHDNNIHEYDILDRREFKAWTRITNIKAFIIVRALKYIGRKIMHLATTYVQFLRRDGLVFLKKTNDRTCLNRNSSGHFEKFCVIIVHPLRTFCREIMHHRGYKIHWQKDNTSDYNVRTVYLTK